MAGLALTKGALEDLTEDIREWFPALPASSIMRRSSSLKSSKVGIFVPSRTVSARQNCYSWNFHYALQPEEDHTFICPRMQSLAEFSALEAHSANGKGRFYHL